MFKVRRGPVGEQVDQLRVQRHELRAVARVA